MEVDFEQKTATVSTVPGRTLSREECQKALAGTSYKISSFESSGA